MIFTPHQTIVFVGNSITDAGRHGSAAPYGDGYVNLVELSLAVRHPELELRVINRGVAGDTIREIAARWDRDVLQERPDWVSLMAGINDVWFMLYSNPFDGVPLPEYEATLRRLLEQTQAAGARLILMTPYLIEADRRDFVRRQIELYADVIKRLAQAYNAILVDTQAAFDAVLERKMSMHWSGDRVHPTNTGHAIIARAWLEAVGWEPPGSG